jgi:hypothetical protein
MSQGQASSTENLTAIMRLPLLRDEEDLHRMLGGNGPSDEHLMSLMHEVTHHLCFSTGPVGVIPAYLETRAASLAYLAQTGSDPEQYQKAAFDSIARSRGATKILRPLAEGLALFSEFDSISGEYAKVQSHVYRAAKSLFIDVRESDLLKAFKAGELDIDTYIIESDRAMRRLIFQERTSDRAIDRKYNLLLQPIGLRNGGYLPGYLRVKDIYNRCALNNPILFRESDLFLCYIVQYIYGDPVLAAALIDPSVDAHEALSSFADRLRERLNHLPSILTKESLEGLQCSMIKNDMRGLAHFTGIEDNDYAKSMRVANRFKEDMELASENPDDPFGVLVNALVKQRHYMYIGDLSAHVWFEEGDAMIDLPSMGVGIRAPVFRTVHAGDAEAIYLISPVSRTSFPIAALYERDNEAVALSWIDWIAQDQERMTNSLLESRLPVRQARELAKAAQGAVSHTLRKSGYDVELDNLVDQLTATIEEIYFRKAANPVNEPELASLRSRMARYGLGGLWEDPELVRRLARLGLASSVASSHTALTKLFEGLGWGALDDEIAVLIEAANQIWPIVLSVFSYSAGGRLVTVSP